MENVKYLKFKGELSKESKKYILKKEINACLILSLIILLVSAIPIIIIALKIHLIVLLFLLLPFISIIGLLLHPFVDLQSVIEIKIKDNNIYISFGNFNISKNIEDIKKIIDFGKGYYIKFYFPPKVLNCLCEKSLIVEGTIEDFENLFKDKIVRK